MATLDEPLVDREIKKHRIVAVADSTLHPSPMSVGILSGQDVLTVASMGAKLEAQLRGLGCGNLPECLARPHIEAGRLIVKRTDRLPRSSRVSYAWREENKMNQGKGLQWWLAQLSQPKTLTALLNHSQPNPTL